MKNILTLLLGLSFGLSIHAQSMYFPKGNTLNLSVYKDVLYTETDIRFHTRNSVSTDYSWLVIFDSIDARWELSMCANGDCKVAIPFSGNFIKDFGDNDTTVFMRFHVNTNLYNGSSRIGVKAYNRNNPEVADTLWFNVTYTNTTGMGEVSPIKIDYAINGNTLQVNNSGVKSLTLYNAIGQAVVTSTTNSLAMPAQHGLYLLNVTFTNNTQSTQKIIW